MVERLFAPAYTGPLMLRDLEVPVDSWEAPRWVYVAGGVPTTLRFPSAVDPQGTTLEDWEGLFEPLAVTGRYVILFPLRELEPAKRHLLRVKLVDGAQIPLTVASGTSVDGAVRFPRTASTEATRIELAKHQRELKSLQEQYRREQELSTSVDHALAALLLRGRFEMTPFRQAGRQYLHTDQADVMIQIYRPRERPNSSGGSLKKVAFTFMVKNKDAVPWRLQEMRLTVAGTEVERPLALRAASTSVAPNENGTFAVVLDFDSYSEQQMQQALLLELFRAGGMREAYVEIVPAELLRR